MTRAGTRRPAIIAIVAALLAGCSRNPPQRYNGRNPGPVCNEDIARCNSAGGEGSSCRKAGFCYFKGIGRPPDPLKALDCFIESCAQGDSLSCMHAGLLRLGDDGVPRDQSAGLACVERACDLTHPMCELAADVFAGTIVPMTADTKHASELRDRHFSVHVPPERVHACAPR